MIYFYVPFFNFIARNIAVRRPLDPRDTPPVARYYVAFRRREFQRGPI